MNMDDVRREIEDICRQADMRRHWMRENGLLRWPDGSRSPRTVAGVRDAERRAERMSTSSKRTAP